MEDFVKVCFICGHKGLDQPSRGEIYLKCPDCGHEIHPDVRQSFMINEKLSGENIRRLGWLDMWKKNVLLACAAEYDFLLDVGSGSGQFLDACKPFFKSCAGLEITPASANFARKEFHLRIEADISKLNEKISVATFWHSLEHMPPEEIERVLNHMADRATPLTRVIVCVPNKRSFQYKMFKKNFAFYDPVHHVHQFSPRSLDLLMARSGFEKTRLVRSWPYAIFAHLQGFLNMVNTTRNYLYERKKRGCDFNQEKARLLLLDGYNILMGLLLFVPSVLGSVVDLLVPERGGVITVCFSPKKK